MQVFTRILSLSLERQQIEADLRETHVQLEAALLAGAIYTWRWKIPENLVIVNQAFAHLFGVDPVQAVGGLPLELFVQAMHEEDRSRVVAAIHQAIETGEEYVTEYRVCEMTIMIGCSQLQILLFPTSDRAMKITTTINLNCLL